MTKEEAIAILPGNPVEWPEDPDMPYLLLEKSRDCEWLTIQKMVTGENFSIPYSEVERTSVFRAGSLVKGRIKDSGDEVIGMTVADIWPNRSGSILFTNNINMSTGAFIKPSDHVQGYFSLPTQEEKRKYCNFLLENFRQMNEENEKQEDSGKTE